MAIKLKDIFVLFSEKEKKYVCYNFLSGNYEFTDNIDIALQFSKIFIFKKIICKYFSWRLGDNLRVKHFVNGIGSIDANIDIRRQDVDKLFVEKLTGKK